MTIFIYLCRGIDITYNFIYLFELICVEASILETKMNTIISLFTQLIPRKLRVNTVNISIKNIVILQPRKKQFKVLFSL